MFSIQRTKVALLVTDADNTLWNTDTIYANAQLALLSSLEEAIGTRVTSEDRLGFIREIDQKLALAHHQHLRYPPHLLVIALALTLRGTAPTEAVQRAVRAPHTIPKMIDPEVLVECFSSQIRTEIPTLRVGVLNGLQKLYNLGVSIVVATEGPEEKCQRLLEHYRLMHLITKTASTPKTVEFFRRLQRLMKARDGFCFSVGDQLDRDIAPAKQAGYTTIYFPGGFKPLWTPEELTIAPDHRITSFEEVCSIMQVTTAGIHHVSRRISAQRE
jgi:putative hydrolase of the HAD superfamily